MGTRYHCDVSGKRYEHVKAFVNIYYGWASHGHDQGILNKVASRELAVIAMCAVPLFANIVECLIFDSVTRACVFVVINKGFNCSWTFGRSDLSECCAIQTWRGHGRFEILVQDQRRLRMRHIVHGISPQLKTTYKVQRRLTTPGRLQIFCML